MGVLGGGILVHPVGCQGEQQRGDAGPLTTGAELLSPTWDLPALPRGQSCHKLLPSEPQCAEYSIEK